MSYITLQIQFKHNLHTAGTVYLLVIQPDRHLFVCKESGVLGNHMMSTLPQQSSSSNDACIQSMCTSSTSPAQMRTAAALWCPSLAHHHRSFVVQCRSDQVRLLAENKDMLGVMFLDEAISTAENEGLDVVLVSPDADPPVCRLMDASKHKYELEKRDKESKKKQREAR